jgi:hypothetical protein
MTALICKQAALKYFMNSLQICLKNVVEKVQRRKIRKRGTIGPSKKRFGACASAAISIWNGGCYGRLLQTWPNCKNRDGSGRRRNRTKRKQIKKGGKPMNRLIGCSIFGSTERTDTTDEIISADCGIFCARRYDFKSRKYHKRSL